MKKKIPIMQLSQHTHAAENALNLVSNAFEYISSNNIKTDFYPLLNHQNWHNFYFIEDQKKVVSTAACLNSVLKTPFASLPITLIGAIATDKDFQGRGYASSLIEHIIFLNKDKVGVIFLWSDLDSLYSKFGFEQIGRQYVYKSKHQSQWVGPVSFKSYNPDEKRKIKNLYLKYIATQFCTIERNEKEWTYLEEMTSAHFYHTYDFDRYFIVHKGQDLTNIIHEYAYSPENKDNILDFSKEFEYWSPIIIQSYTPEKILYSCLALPANNILLDAFIKSLGVKNNNWRELFSQTAYPFYISGIDSV